MAFLSLKNVNKDFYGLACVTGISFEVFENETVVLAGPEQCGKSVILRIIAGIDRETSGEIYCNGKLYNNIPLKQRNIGLVFTRTAYFKRKSLYDNIAYGLKIRKADRAEIDLKVRQAAEILGIEDDLYKKAKFLTDDVKQLAVTARAVIRHPDILLMDEPFLEENNDLLLEKFLKLIEAFPATCIYASHNLNDIKFLNRKTIILDEYGMIQQIDSFQNILKNPVNEFVAEFIKT